MADVVVTTVNMSGQKVSLILDDAIERDVELIASLKRQVRREDLDTIKVEPRKKPVNARAPKKVAE